MQLRGRIRELHGDAPPFDLLLVICEGLDPGHTWRHPLIQVRWHNCTEFEAVLAGKDMWSATFTKLAALSLVEYDKVLVVDLDVVMLDSVAEMMQEQTAPAMVPWKEFPNFQYNSGVVLFKPSGGVP